EARRNVLDDLPDLRVNALAEGGLARVRVPLFGLRFALSVRYQYLARNGGVEGSSAFVARLHVGAAVEARAEHALGGHRRGGVRHGFAPAAFAAASRRLISPGEQCQRASLGSWSCQAVKAFSAMETSMSTLRSTASA